MSLQNSQQISDVKILLKKGMDGNGIVSIEKTGTQDNIDTYTITYEDGGKDTFTVTNGRSINSIAKTGTSGLVDTYTITFNDTQTATFTVTNGRSIVSIAKTGSSAGVDTYTISYNDNTTSTFTVTNGTVASGISYSNSSSHMTADDVQEAIDELNSTKVSKSGDTMTGSLEIQGDLIIDANNSGGNMLLRQTTDPNYVCMNTLPAEDGTLALTKNVIPKTGGTVEGDLDVRGILTTTYFFNISNPIFERMITLGLPSSLTGSRTILFPDASGTVALTSQIARSNTTPLSNYSNIQLDRFGKCRTLSFGQTGVNIKNGYLCDSSDNMLFIPEGDRPRITIYGTVIYRDSANSNDHPAQITISNTGGLTMRYYNGTQFVGFSDSNSSIYGTISFITE